jgi:hypothetical protein
MVTTYGQGEATRVRDVIVCASSPNDLDDGEIQEHPPVGLRRLALRLNAPEVVDLGEGITLMALDRQEAEMVMDACSPAGLNFEPIRQFGQRYTFARERSLAEFEQAGFGFDEDGGKLQDALFYSRLIRDNGFSLQYAARIIERGDAEPIVVYKPGSQGKEVYRLRNRREWLDAAEAAELADLLAAFWRAEEFPRRVTRALWRCEWASWSPWIETMLPTLVGGLESLLKTRRYDLTALFKRRATALATELEVDGIDEDFCARIYDGRSDWVHGSAVTLFSREGGQPTEDDRTGVLAEVARVQDLLRAVCRRAIEDAEFRQVFADDAAINERWPA